MTFNHGFHSKHTFNLLKDPKQVRNEPAEPPPIARHIIRHPWQLQRLLKRDVPEK